VARSAHARRTSCRPGVFRSARVLLTLTPWGPTNDGGSVVGRPVRPIRSCSRFVVCFSLSRFRLLKDWLGGWTVAPNSGTRLFLSTFPSPSFSPVRVAILTALLACCVVRSVFLLLSYTYFHTSCAIKKVRLLCVRGSGTHDRSAPCSRLCHHSSETRRGGASRSAMRIETRPEILSLRNPCLRVTRAMLVMVTVSAGECSGECLLSVPVTVCLYTCSPMKYMCSRWAGAGPTRQLTDDGGQ